MANEKPIQKDIAYYMALPYTIQIKHMNDESGSYHLATVAELEGCKSHGDTPEEALKMVSEAMEGYLEVKLDFGDEIPEPVNEEQFSGKWLQRAPKSLHKHLMERAAAEGISFNQYCLYKLSK
ncbi:toxin-antitoxin system HicB family antitoxin [Paenibacillus polymyxa]|uniref:toxin-antitoxin system HicB family antitoxin n=1 Tax=Paenibacillus polymyxa TaxID=1406 RepID=UPI002AB33B33|nr:toxin-antitoxin system HicB family antitoxin [Paenibacillus polymyxa]MDY8094191.1 toxin-antitoxin system HicB family antitoxin [Paenibacillus polymyxa]